jgi:cob(I)alamin adenosyltransferase
MVTLNRIYTRTGDGGDTRLASGEPARKTSLRVEAYGSVDEANSALGLARLSTAKDAVLDAMLARIQNELFDLGADLATPTRAEKADRPALRILPEQVLRLEGEIDRLNGELAPLTSFVLPGGTPAAAALHPARTISRRAERIAVALDDAEPGEVSRTALSYLNRLSDFLFVASRWANARGAGDVLWKPGATRES